MAYCGIYIVAKKKGQSNAENTDLLKLFLKIVHCQMLKRIADTQFGFMKGMGTKDALFSIQELFQ